MKVTEAGAASAPRRAIAGLRVTRTFVEYEALLDGGTASFGNAVDNYIENFYTSSKYDGHSILTEIAIDMDPDQGRALRDAILGR